MSYYKYSMTNKIFKGLHIWYEESLINRFFNKMSEFYAKSLTGRLFYKFKHAESKSEYSFTYRKIRNAATKFNVFAYKRIISIVEMQNGSIIVRIAKEFLKIYRNNFPVFYALTVVPFALTYSLIRFSNGSLGIMSATILIIVLISAFVVLKIGEKLGTYIKESMLYKFIKYIFE